jgi:hypothetical protein
MSSHIVFIHYTFLEISFYLAPIPWNITLSQHNKSSLYDTILSEYFLWYFLQHFSHDESFLFSAVSYLNTVYCGKMVSSGMLRCVALVRTDVSEEPSASFIRVTRIGELGTTLDATSNRCTTVLTRATRRNIPEDTILHSHRCENLKSYTVYCELYLYMSQGQLIMLHISILKINQQACD